MYEVEVKVSADLTAVRDRLDALDAEHVGSTEQNDTYYDAPHRDFAETDEALRIRLETPDRAAGRDAEGSDGNEEPVSKVTYKGPLVEAESKTREEHETAVDDGDEMDAILNGLGFEPAATVHKDREFYALDAYTVTLDDVRDVGEYVEVERTVEQANVETAREGAFEVLRKLQLDPSNQIRTSYLGLKLAEE